MQHLTADFTDSSNAPLGLIIDKSLFTINGSGTAKKK